MKNNLLKLFNCLLSGIVSLLGFQSCDNIFSNDDNSEILLMYGSPYATYKIDVTVTDQSGKGIDNDTVVLRQLDSEGNPVYNYFIADTLITDSEGKADSKLRGSPAFDTYRVIAMGKGGKYESDSIEVKLSQIEKGDDDWCVGIFAAEANLKLKEKK